jgi:predicted DNA binding CopG/RHH family protein
MGRKNKSLKLSKEELLLDSEAGWEALDPGSDRHKKILAAVKVASESVKEERATIRFNRQDLALLKLKAERKGLGYQTLIGSIVHMYVTGQLVELEEARLTLKTLAKKRA